VLLLDLFEDDAKFFHNYYKDICDEFDTSEKLYPACKEACDSYFYIPARREHRGIGGIFFDDLDTVGNASCKDGDRSRVFSFVRAVAEGFMPSYLPIAQRRRSLPYGDKERQWQLVRRGRYLEFNLLYDRGVKFGLDGGRMESIMVSGKYPYKRCFVKYRLRLPIS
jgi:coproporphyrinogen III oxidase